MQNLTENSDVRMSQTGPSWVPLRGIFMNREWAKAASGRKADRLVPFSPKLNQNYDLQIDHRENHARLALLARLALDYPISLKG